MLSFTDSGMFYGVIAGLRGARPRALDNYDTLFTSGDYQDKEIRMVQQATTRVL